jgi:hypothetical protein
MLNLIRRTKPKNIQIKCSETRLEINGIELIFPTNFASLVELFGEPSKTSRTKLTRSYINCWDEYGVYCNYASSDKILGISLILSKNHSLENFPNHFFNGEIFISNKKINHQELTQTAFENYVLKKITYQGEQKPYAISIRLNPNTKKEISHDKYLIKELKEEQITFKDFGFKLAIIQELMYNQELLKPKFDLSEFVKWYDKRTIDLEKEGYEPIAEVTQYFKDLPIPKKFASEITEIYQDGGNDIYLQLLRFGEGSEDYWDIKTIEDIKQFPNLKKVVLCYAQENIIEDLNSMGIEAEWI